MGIFSVISLYFDPGIGALIVQGLVAAAAGILLLSRNALWKVKAFFGLVKKEDDTFDSIDIEDEDTQEDEDK